MLSTNRDLLDAGRLRYLRRLRRMKQVMATRVRSHSKINLGLAIGPPRPDGFHHLSTLYQTLALYDVVTVSAVRASATAITLTSNHPDVPTDQRNTAWRMVERCLERLHLQAEVTIHIEKNLPIQGGMGAGSANAAAALLGLERELGVALPALERLELAATVGSDVPLFLLGGSVLGQGRGEHGVAAAGSAGDALRDRAAERRGFDAAGLPGLGRAAARRGRRRVGRRVDSRPPALIG